MIELVVGNDSKKNITFAISKIQFKLWFILLDTYCIAG